LPVVNKKRSLGKKSLTQKELEAKKTIEPGNGRLEDSKDARPAMSRPTAGSRIFLPRFIEALKSL
jgi:hypothetical protein